MYRSVFIRKVIFLAAAFVCCSAYAQFPMGGGFGGGMPMGGFGGGMPMNGLGEGMPMGGFGGMMGGVTSYNPAQDRNKVDFTSSNLPVIHIDTDGKPVTSNEKIPASMKVSDGCYDGGIRIKLRGNSSLSFEQKCFTFKTDTSAAILGMPAGKDWVLRAPYNDISMMRDAFAFNMWTEMGHWAPRYRFCEVVMNGTYIGVYTLCEKIERAGNRIDIAKLKPEDKDITGGYIIRIDPLEAGEKGFQSEVPGIMSGGFGGGFGGFRGGISRVTWNVYYPDEQKLTDEQLKYISDYVNTVEKVIQSDGFSDPVNGYARLIDVESFVDYLIHTELSLNADGLKRSTYFYKDKGGKLVAGSVWDYNLAYGNCNFCNANKIDAWVYEGGETNPTPAMWKRLMEDPGFVAKVKARWKQLRKDVISLDHIYKFIDDNAKLLEQPGKRQYSKYTDLLVKEQRQQSHGGFGGFGGGLPGMGGFGGGDAIGMFAAYRVSSYDEEIRILKKWFADRIAFLDSNWK